jgi:type IV pilus assembly protein PilW
MNKQNHIHVSQAGVTLIELLVSITIGLVILVAIGTAYINTTNSARQRENQSELNEPARVVLRILQHDLSNAGYVDIFDRNAATGRPQAASIFIPGDDDLVNLFERVPEAVPLGTPLTQFFAGRFPVFGCDGAMNSTPDAIAIDATPTVTCGAASEVRQSLQIAYQAAPAPSVVNPAVSLLAPDGSTGEGRDCAQQSLPDAPAFAQKFVINRYFLGINTSDGVSELYCSGSGNAIQQPFARGVEEFVLRYQTALPGVAPPVGSNGIAAGGSQAQYVSAATVNASALGWANVTAVEVCMVSATAGTSGAAATGTVNLQPTRPTCQRGASGAFAPNVARAAGDLRLWKRFTSVVSIRNAVYSTPN